MQPFQAELVGGLAGRDLAISEKGQDRFLAQVFLVLDLVGSVVGQVDFDLQLYETPLYRFSLATFHSAALPQPPLPPQSPHPPAAPTPPPWTHRRKFSLRPSPYGCAPYPAQSPTAPSPRTLPPALPRCFLRCLH